MVSDQERLSRLEALAAAATPGPWRLGYDSRTASLRASTIYVEGAKDLPLAHVWLPMPWRGAGGDVEQRGETDERRADADAALIVALVNAFRSGVLVSSGDQPQ